MIKISDMERSNSGGPGAIQGYNYQIYAGVYYSLLMLENKEVLEVRFEVADDIDLVYSDSVEFVQVKTTESDSKWSIKEFAHSDINKIPPKPGRKRIKKISKQNSILHKSLCCDKIANKKGFFRILTKRDVKKELEYLKVNFQERINLEVEREQILKRLKKEFNLYTNNSSSEYTSKKGNGLEYWIDNATWQVIPSERELKLLCLQKINSLAFDLGYSLRANGDSESILALMLESVYTKGGLPRSTSSVKDKSYDRIELNEWFISQLKKCCDNNIKIYTLDSKKLSKVLKELYRNEWYNTTLKLEAGFVGKYQRKQYAYKNIASSLINWFPEVLLLPREFIDNSLSKIHSLISKYKDLLDFKNNDVENIISKSLLHSIIRTEYPTQPIPARLYIEDEDNTCLDNVHILINRNKPDQLIMGFSYFINEPSGESIDSIIHNFDDFIGSEAFDSKKEKILSANDSDYLIKNDIDEILEANVSLDEFIDRFIFVFFIGYESSYLEESYNPNIQNDDSLLKDEIKCKFDRLIDGLIEESEFYLDLNINVYLYPLPNIQKLCNSVQDKVRELWTTK